MQSVAEVLFWISLVLILYTYAGYPLLLLMLTTIRKSSNSRLSASKTDALPEVSLIIAAYNEEDIIIQKINNTGELDYPADKLEIIIVTDGSSDDTPQIVSGFPGIRLLHLPERQGKLAAMNRAVAAARSDILVFSDANGYLNPPAIKKLVRHYADPHVGGVSGEKRVISPTGAVEAGEGLYWKYESLLKKLDSELYTIVGAAGELFSLRKRLYSEIPGQIVIEDFVQSLLLCTKGYAVRYEPEAWSSEYPSLNLSDEMERKIRISAGGFQAMAYLRQIFNIFRYPMLSFLYISHRVLRWTLAPLALVVLFFTSWALYRITFESAWLFFALGQTVFYLLAVGGWLFARRGIKLPILYIAFYFVFMNYCVFAGFYRFLSNQQKTTWNKASRLKKI